MDGSIVDDTIDETSEENADLLEADLLLDGESSTVMLEKTDDGYMLEGDMIVTDLLVPELGDPDDTDGEIHASMVTSQNLLWPGGVVPYTIAANLPNKARVYEAMKRWSANTPLRFVPRTNQRDYVHFQVSNGCSANVGRIGGRQVVNLSSFCNVGLTIHEIGHAVGMFHEQSRSDRDSYVRIYWDNIQAGRASQFWKRASIKRGGYDYASIMHYGSYEFSRNGYATILRRNNGRIKGPGQKYYPSAGDNAAIRKAYGSVACPLGNGRYCGGNYIGGAKGNLYQCTGGQLRLIEKCAAGCFEAPAGEPDRCASQCAYGDGRYCGGNGVTGNRKSLYRCEGGTKTKIRNCDMGCVARDAGQDDSCSSTCPLGDGRYCGGNRIGGAKGTLYDCAGGSLSAVTSCEAGCLNAPTGEPDTCNPECPLGDGMYCGGNYIGGNEGTLYECQDGGITAVEACAQGCFEAPPGVSDSCK